MHVLFGETGWERIGRALQSIQSISRKVERVEEDMLACAIRYGRGASQLSTTYDDDTIIASLHRISRKPARSQKFLYAGLKRGEELEWLVRRLCHKLSVLERLSDLYLEAEHPDLFSPIRRLPGRRNLSLENDEKSESVVEDKVADAESARKDAELLYKASLHAPSYKNRLRDEEGEAEGEIGIESIHIGIHVPTLRRRSFAFLLSPVDDTPQDLLTHPVKIKSGNLPSTFSTALPYLLSAPPDVQERSETYILPSSHHTSGFHLSISPTPLLSSLQFKDSISTILTSRVPALSQQVLYPRDQLALACGITAGSFQLLRTPWAERIGSTSVRWARTAEGGVSIMLDAAPTSSTRPRAADLRRQIFNIGILVAEIALKTPLVVQSSSHHDDDVRIFLAGPDGSKTPVDTVELAAEVECMTNVLAGNIVFFCLTALKERRSDDAVDKMYCREVLGLVDELEEVMKKDEKRTENLISTPRRERERRASRSNRNSIVYVH